MQKEVQKLITDQLDTLKKLVVNTCKEYETTQAPLNLIDKAVSMAQIDLKAVKGRKLTKFFREYNKCLNLMNTMCKENAEAMNVKSVPLSVFELFIGEIRSGFVGS